MDRTLDEKLADARRRRNELAPSPVPAAGEETVLLSFRVAVELREQVHEAARLVGAPSTQAWLTDVVGRAVKDAHAPHPELTDALRRRIVEHLSAAVDDGTYADWAASLDDPELRDLA